MRFSGEHLMQFDSHSVASGEEHSVHLDMLYRCSRHFGSAVEQVQHPRRQSGGVPCFGQPLSGSWRQLTRFENDRIARQERWHNVSSRQMRRQIERSKNQHHPMGTIACDRQQISHLFGCGPASFEDRIEGIGYLRGSSSHLSASDDRG